ARGHPTVDHLEGTDVHRAPAWLFTLLSATFVLYTDDYVIAGILPELAHDLNVSEGQAGQLVTVFSLTVAVAAPVAAGVPLGTWIGGALGWRATFVTASAAGLCVLVAALATLPRRHRLEDVPRLGEQLRTLRRPAISLGLLANTALMTGSMMMLTYLAPYLAEAAAAGVNERAFVF